MVTADIGAALDRLDAVRTLGSSIDLTVSEPDDAYLPVSERAMPALRCLSQGLSRVAMVEHPGMLGKNWDSHFDGYMQSAHFEILFSDSTRSSPRCPPCPGRTAEPCYPRPAWWYSARWGGRLSGMR